MTVSMNKHDAQAPTPKPKKCDPKGYRFLLLAYLLVSIGSSLSGGAWSLMYEDDPSMPLPAVLALVTAGMALGAICLIGAKKYVDKYADRRH
jgi:hypothetical protein